MQRKPTQKPAEDMATDPTLAGTQTPQLVWRPLLVSIESAAALLSLGRVSVWDLVMSGEIRSVRYGKRRLIPVKELERWIDAQLDEAA